MPFIRNYNGAVQILAQMGTGTCKGTCKSSWMRNIKYALKSKTNPLGLTKPERKSLTEKVRGVSGRNAVKSHSMTLKKYRTRDSPPYPANEFCGKEMKGNDGRTYLSKPNAKGVCAWRRK